jgi:light-regulated signal transduction histidine kinase (bacteriophytochrome)
VATVSQDLRATLALIGGYSQSLVHLSLDDATRQRHLDGLLAATDALTEVADRILELSSPGSERPLLRPQPVAVGWLVARAARAGAGGADAPVIEYEGDEALPTVDVDPTWISHALRMIAAYARGRGEDEVVEIRAQRAGTSVVLTVRPAHPVGPAAPGFGPIMTGTRPSALAVGAAHAATFPDLHIAVRMVEANGGTAWFEGHPGRPSVGLALPTLRTARPEVGTAGYTR